jgi:hypothetical protein
MFTYTIKISGDTKELVVNGIANDVSIAGSRIESLEQMTLSQVVKAIRGTKNVVGILGKFKD